MSEFTRETLIRYADPTNKAFGPTVRHLAAYTLTLLDRAERAERELAEAEGAIRNIRSKVLSMKTGEPREVLWNLLKYAERWQSCDPAVRRALDRKGEG